MLIEFHAIAVSVIPDLAYRRRLSSRNKSLRNELSVPKYKWFLPWALPDLAFVSTSQERSQEDTEHKNVSPGSPMTSKMSPKSIQNIIFPKWAMCVSKVPKNMKRQFYSVRFRSVFEPKIWSDFFLELYLLLPLCLLLKNAPKETFGHTNVPQGSQMSSKMSPKLIQNMTFYQSGQCVSHTVNTMLFFTLANPKCDQKHQKTHPATHTGTLVSHSLKNVIQMAPKYVSMDPQDPPL